MSALLRRIAGGLRWRGHVAVTIPPMDGAFKPNTALDSAPIWLHIDSPDNLIADGKRVLFSSRNFLFQLPEQTGTPVQVARFEHEVTCLASRPGGGIAAGLEDGRSVILGERPGEAPFTGTTVAKLGCPTAMIFLDNDTLCVCVGSSENPPSEWKRDLMQRNASGSVWQIQLASGRSRMIAAGLAFPNGLMSTGVRGALVVSESWRHRLITVSADSKQAAEPVLANLPGYPARLAASANHGAWLSIFAPRNRLTEFMLRESRYREDMLREVDPEFWIGPRLVTGRSFLEPLQCGAVQSMGILKPWSPSASYGLIVRLDQHFRPVASFHSRAGGAHHGITSCLEVAGRLFVASKGGNAILAITPPSADADY